MFSNVCKTLVISLVTSSALAGGGTVGSSTLANQTEDGFFVCTTSEGTILAAGLDGEANVSNARVTQATSGSSAKLEIESLDIRPEVGFEATLIRRMEEEGIVYKIKAKSRGISAAKITESAGESSRVLDATCVVKFKAAL